MLAGLTPSEWEISVLDENLGPIDFDSLPRPDLVGITAFTSQAPRAYEIAGRFRAQRVPVVMGGIHATMRSSEASRYVESLVTGEAEAVWAEVLEDARIGRLRPRYEGGRAAMEQIVPARHDLLRGPYAFGCIQTTRGCPLNCAFCSVTEFNGARYRQRPISEVVREFRAIPEKRVLIVDDNLIGRKPEHIERAKELFRALAEARTGKRWIGQTTVNFADDEELLDLAGRAGCAGLFIGFESVAPKRTPELGRKSAMLSGRDIPASIERIHKHNILVVGSFIIGLDSDGPGVGRQIAHAARRYGVDNMNVLFLTPLPGTRLWKELEVQGRIASNAFPEDWKYYTLTYPVARYKHLSGEQVIREMKECNRTFYSAPNIVSRTSRTLLGGRNPMFVLAGNLSSRKNSRRFSRAYEDLGPMFARVEQVELHDVPNPGLIRTWRNKAEPVRRAAATLKLQVASMFRQS